MMKKTVTFLIIFIFVPAAISAQWRPNPECRIGYGYYETFNIGLSLELRSDNRIGFGAGTNYLINNKMYYSVFIEDNMAVFRSRRYNYIEYKWYLTGKIIYWDLEDDQYRFNVLSLSPGITRCIPLNSKLKLTLDAGVVLNIVLDNYQKTNLTQGGPYPIMPNIRLLLNLRL
jgi:hypothetical protein